jgi:hypothetical protein
MKFGRKPSPTHRVSGIMADNFHPLAREEQTQTEGRLTGEKQGGEEKKGR